MIVYYQSENNCALKLFLWECYACGLAVYTPKCNHGTLCAPTKCIYRGLVRLWERFLRNRYSFSGGIQTESKDRIIYNPLEELQIRNGPVARKQWNVDYTKERRKLHVTSRPDCLPAWLRFCYSVCLCLGVPY